MVLMIGMACSLIIPSIPITIYVTQPASEKTNTHPLPIIAEPIVVTTDMMSFDPPTKPIEKFDWTLLIFSTYLIGVFSLLAFRAVGIVRVMMLIKNSRQLTTYHGIAVLVTQKPTPPFCFGRRIIISKDEPTQNLDIILAHELSHINHHHNVDLTIINLLLSFMWFNPAVWLLRNEVVLLQEHQADRQVLQNGIDAKQYQYLLISRVTSKLNLQPVVNHFGKSYLYKRISMMKKQSKPIGKLKLLIIAPLLTIAVVAYAQIEPKPSANNGQLAEFTMPFSGKIASIYGEQINPITKEKVTHNGIDIVTDNDTVRSPFSGVVTFCEFDDNGSGNKLVIAHPNGIETTYAHLAKFLVSKGATIKSGEPIAIVGNTGRSAGKHLHFECRKNGELIDPMSIISQTAQKNARYFEQTKNKASLSLRELKSLLNSSPKAIIETTYDNGTVSIASQTDCSNLSISVDEIDFSQINGWDVMGGAELKELYPDCGTDYLIRLWFKLPTDIFDINMNGHYKVYDKSGTLIKEAFGSKERITASIPADRRDGISCQYQADKMQ